VSHPAFSPLPAAHQPSHRTESPNWLRSENPHHHQVTSARDTAFPKCPPPRPTHYPPTGAPNWLRSKNPRTAVRPSLTTPEIPDHPKPGPSPIPQLASFRRFPPPSVPHTNFPPIGFVPQFLAPTAAPPPSRISTHAFPQTVRYTTVFATGRMYSVILDIAW
jgi:hypothetical protein